MSISASDVINMLMPLTSFGNRKDDCTAFKNMIKNTPNKLAIQVSDELLLNVSKYKKFISITKAKSILTEVYLIATGLTEGQYILLRASIFLALKNASKKNRDELYKTIDLLEEGKNYQAKLLYGVNKRGVMKLGEELKEMIKNDKKLREDYVRYGIGG